VILSKVLFSKLQLATYIYSIHYIFPFEFILGYIIRRLVIIIIITWRNRHFLHVAENQENDCLYFQLCFAELKDYKGRSKRLFKLILAFQGGFWRVLY